MTETVGRIVAVWSPKSEGATVTALHLARAAAPQEETLLLDLNLRRPQVEAALPRAVSLERNAVDMLLPQAQVGTLTAAFLREVAARPEKAGPAVVAGLRQPEYGSTLESAPLGTLLRVARSAFPLTVVDVAADLENAGTDAALAHADLILVVLRGTWLSLHAYHHLHNLLIQLGSDVSRHRLVLTQAHPGDPYRPVEAAEYVGVPVLQRLPFVPELDVAIGLGEPVRSASRAAADYLRQIGQLASLSLRGKEGAA